MKFFKETLNIFSSFEIRRTYWIFLIVVFMALIETVGVISVMPFLAVLGNTEMIQTSAYLNTVYIISQDYGIKTTSEFLVLLGLASLSIILFDAFFRIYANHQLNMFVESIRHSLSVRLLSSYLGQPYVFFLDRNSADIQKTILSEVDSIIGAVLRPMLRMIAYSFVILFLVTALFLIDQVVTFFTITSFAFIYFFIYFLLRRKLTSLGSSRLNSNKQRFKIVGETLGGIKEIKLMNLEDIYVKDFEGPSKNYAMTQGVYNTLSQVPNFIIEALVFGAILLYTIFLLKTSGIGESSFLGEALPMIGLYALAAYRIKPAIQNVYHGFASMNYGKSAIENLSKDLNLIRKEQDSTEVYQDDINIDFKNTLTLENISFSYPNTKNEALSNINIEIRVGSSIGIVGETGSGKTTLIDIILGLLIPDKGGLKVDERKIDISSLESWQKKIGYVPQDIYLLDASIAENIALGVSSNDIDEENIEKCASTAKINRYIHDQLPDKYLTKVGERGVRLSGGQRQRIGIARALYHNPEVLIFDEATSALDSNTENQVIEKIKELAPKKTIIMVAHRLSTVRNCDQILLFDNGKLIEVGTFTQLESRSEIFQRMVNNSL